MVNQVLDQELEGEVIKTEPQKEFDLTVDRDPALFYESRKWLYLLTLPLMFLLVVWTIFKKIILGGCKINSHWVDGVSPACRKIKEGAGSWRALHIAYNHKFGEKNLQGRISDYWLGMLNGQAVRNRKKLVKRELTKVVRELWLSGIKEPHILSIAAGSAEALLEVIHEMKSFGITVKATLLDPDSSAIEFCKRKAKELGIDSQLDFFLGGTTNLAKAVNGNAPHVVEMVGFLDYRPHVKAVHLIKKIYHLLSPGGKLITSNICPNPEQEVLHWLFDWSMIYRKPEELGQVVVEGEFDPENCQLVCEPLRIYTLAICRKNN